MNREKDVRDRLVSAALRYSENELAIRALTKRMHSAVCLLGSPPCWAKDEDDLALDGGVYCSACARATLLHRERHALKLRRVLRREVLLARALEFGGTNGASKAGPVTGSGGVNRDHTGGAPCITHPSTVTT